MGLFIVTIKISSISYMPSSRRVYMPLIRIRSYSACISYFDSGYILDIRSEISEIHIGK